MTSSLLLHHPSRRESPVSHAHHRGNGRSLSGRRLQPGLSRRVAQAAATFEFLLFGRPPIGVTVAAHDGELVVIVLASFSPLERRLARRHDGRRRVTAWHEDLFAATRAPFRDHVCERAGVDLRNGLLHVDAETGSITKTFSTAARVDFFLLGDGRPGLGVPVDAHLQATVADGNGPVRS